MQKKQEQTGLVWFRNDLRTRDNASLSHSIRENKRIIAVYCLDPREFEKSTFGFTKMGVFRAKFLLESLTELKENLQKLHISLLVFNENPEYIIPQLVEQYNVQRIYFQKEWTRDEKEVEKCVRSVTPNVSFSSYYDQFLYHPDDTQLPIEKIPRIFTDFRKKLEKYEQVQSVLPLPHSMPKENLLKDVPNIPTLKQLNFEQVELPNCSAFPFQGGENSGLVRLASYTFETNQIASYKHTRNGLIGTDYSSKFSAWLANGSISSKTIYWKVKQYEQEIKKNQSTYWLIFELIWRDFFKYISLKHQNQIFNLTGINNSHYEWSNNSQKVNDWINGQTPEPFVNANMIELKKTGWMSNRGRQNVASYFAKNRKLDWRIGSSYFQSMLVDYDVHSNYGNWMYVSGVGNDPRNRIFNVKLQAERYDPSNEYQNLWLNS